MDWDLVWKAIVSLAGFGLLLGALLAIASRRFYVEVDPRVEKVLNALPKSNCGACGLPGCEAAAEAVVQGRVPVSVCRAGGPQVTAEVARIMGVEFETGIPRVARIHCKGGIAVSPLRAHYQGVSSCRAADITGAHKACPFGCLGLHDCADVCPVNAIIFDKQGLRRVIARKCTGCGLCIDACPRGLIELVPANSKVISRCKSQYIGKKATEVCRVACIGCRKCEKACPNDAIKVENGYAVIDYDKCDGCMECAMVCPTDTIEIWVEMRGHPEGGEFVVPPKKRKGSKET